MVFSRQHKREAPSEVLTELRDLTMNMEGTQDAPLCKSKGAETYGLLCFLVWYMGQLSARLGERGAGIQRAGLALVEIVNVWKQAGHALTTPGMHRVFDLHSERMCRMERHQCCIKKHRLFWHLLFNIPWHGNPSMYATWEDESLNKSLKMSCRMTSQATFVESVLLRMREQLRAKRRHMQWDEQKRWKNPWKTHAHTLQSLQDTYNHVRRLFLARC